MAEYVPEISAELLKEKYELARNMMAPDAETAHLGKPIASEADVAFTYLDDMRTIKVSVRITSDFDEMYTNNK